MALVWAAVAMPIMCSAFLMDDFCSSTTTGNNGTNHSVDSSDRRDECSPRPGTVTAEFNLDSNHSYLADIATSAFVGGMAIGSIFMPLLGDRKGRRSAVLCSLFLCGFVGCASAFSPNIFVFIAMRFVQGLSFSGCAMLNFVLAYECIPLRLRSQSALVFGLMWMVGYCLVAPVAYFSTNWRQLIAAASGPSILFGLFYLFTIPESFHFLVAQKKLEDVKKWVGKANKFASKAGTRKIGKDELEKERIWTNRTLIIYLIVFCFLWTCDTFIYYGLSLFSAQLAGDRYINFTLVALAEVPAYVFAPVLLEKMGRRLFTSLTHILASCAFFAVLISDNAKFFLILWLIGKFAISSSFTGLFVYTSEVFPTVHRGLCMGICTAVSQGSSIFAPSVRIMVI
uniref:MFS domain-containing protein n=1 Tax=Globodera pallida TaxID=36090 RepID=A0A183C6M1_GLOPA